jgi:hypothetical protein
MFLELSRQQVNLLHAFLTGTIEDLHDEIVHTDESELREQLRAQLQELQDLQRHVEALKQQEQPSP